MKNEPPYKIQPVVSFEDVPNWSRRPAKWDELVEVILALRVGQSLPVKFNSAAEGAQARNTIRDTVNRENGKVILRTRMVEDSNGATVFFTLVSEPKKKL